MTPSTLDDGALAAATDEREPGLLGRLGGATAFWMALVLFGLVALFSAISPQNAFLNVGNFFTIALNASQLTLLALGMTYLLGARQLDLSIAANVVLASILSAKTITALMPAPGGNALGAILCGMVVALVAGTLFGLVNGLLVTRLKLSSFLATLATSTIGLGAALVITSGANVPGLPRVLQTSFGIYRIGGVVPVPVVIALAAAAVLWFFLAKTRFGVRTLAIGSAPEAARRAGIAVDRQLMTLFGMMGFLCGLTAILDISRFATTNIGGHQTDAMQAIAAAVIGGTSLFGGSASVVGAVIGALIPVVLGTGLVIMRVDSFYQLIAVGLIVIVAVAIDQRRRAGQA
ncbi:sugar ABC transporter permease [Aureimonas endophytica]|uniref:Sugar ABC transporter permease n=1 Tax=Aureimonas endophytica TaxID=2027858 RepID=A0A916ZLX3_9HYPH|nr:ABC transporter permease [Aureimonas endophytica]GGE04125.1 sugar ABC transporter permease [Aureimonas endophytica]